MRRARICFFFFFLSWIALPSAQLEARRTSVPAKTSPRSANPFKRERSWQEKKQQQRQQQEKEKKKQKIKSRSSRNGCQRVKTVEKKAA